MAGGEDTIVARATPDGRSAVAVVRVSGARAIEIARALGASAAVDAPRVMTRATLHHAVTGDRLDDALVTVFRAPRSYTGEDVVELSTHGGRVASTLVVAACVAAGARLALPGEFTRRGVLNGKLDLVQAEAVGDLIDARTVAMHQQALAQLDGGLSRRLLALRNDLIQLEALLAYDIDFPDEDDGPIAPARLTAAASRVVEELEALLATAPAATLLRDGALVVIAGPPNAGKSSLFNALLGEARALVTPIAGTTRDAVDALLDRTPTPLRLVDTAGLRDTTDLLERLGIEVSERYLASAHVVLVCGDHADDVRRAMAVVQAHTSAPLIGVHTKTDAHETNLAREVTWSYVSANTGEGLVALLERVDHVVSQTAAAVTRGDDTPVVTRERQQRGLRESRDEVLAFLDGWRSAALPATVAAVHLQSARDALADVVGVIATEDILDRVFADFCIGK